MSFKPNSKILESNEGRSIRLTEKEKQYFKLFIQELRKCN